MTFTVKQPILAVLIIFSILLNFAGESCFASSPSNAKPSNEVKNKNNRPPLKIKLPKTIIQCLGQEENLIHQYQYNGPLYSLNQKLLNAFIYNSDLRLKESVLKRICLSEEFTPSVNLLKALLTERHSLFEFKQTDPIQKLQSQQMLDVFLQEVPTFFFQYLADVSALMPSSNCLKNHLPQVSRLLYEYQYVEAEAEYNPKLMGKKRLEEIFRELVHLDVVVKRCQEDVKKEALDSRKNKIPK
jgi:hypothetical protein